MAVQSLKAAGAAVLAWALTGWWWDAPMALMAPWAAVALVQSTVYRSVLSGLQQMAVIAIGTVLAATAAAFTGNTMAAMVLVLPVTVLLGNWARFGQQGIYAPTTALFVLAYGSSSYADVGHRLLETLVGALIGIGVNALVLPPVHLRDVRERLERLPRESASLLHTMASGMASGYDRSDAETWHDRARRLSDIVTGLHNARDWTQESYRFNPGHRLRRNGPALPSQDLDSAWDRVVHHVISLTRLLVEAAGGQPSLRPPPGSALEQLSEVLHHAADLCLPERLPAQSARGVTGPPAERGRLSAEAWRAHRRLKSQVLTHDSETATSLGGLVAETQQLLSALEPRNERD
ncbi:aromatic acid exporter family protein [Streptomyces sp. ISL-10]|uniref:FUSC family protein n=1 Tax=Streptomyces sp. ISL-10 TaxID=2819172 RepID=UPI0027E5BA08|nr:aromatic acid exporter family protein [Streptomyces sp. ISL-10]